MKLFRKLSLIASCFLFSVCSLLMGLQMSGKIKSTEAVSTSDTSSYVKVNEIWNGTEFNSINLNKLLQLVSGDSSVNFKKMETIDEMARSTTSDGQPGTSAATIRAKTYGKTSSQDVIVRFAGLDWQVMYLSKDKSGNPILTLWLSNNIQEAFAGRSSTEGEYYGFIDGGLYSDWSADCYSPYYSITYPTLMYGSSYINAVTLNNGGMYVSGVSTTGSSSATVSTKTASQTSSSVFAKFTMPNVSESVTKYLVTPNQVPWQLNQDSRTGLGDVWTYNSPNENAGPLNSYNWYTNPTYGSASFMLEGASANYYYKWAENYLWLPSSTEAGGYKDGIWQTSTEQRKTYEGYGVSGKVGSSNANGYLNSSSWLRSGHVGSSLETEALCVYWQGSSPSPAHNDTYTSCAVRPALHLNLNAAVTAASTPEYTFVFDLNGGNIDGATYTRSVSGIKEGSNYGFINISGSTKIPQRTGYTLSGWSCSAGGTYNTGLDGSFTLTVPSYGSDTITFTAQWVPNSYTVAASANGGSIVSTSGWTGTGTVALKKVTYGSSYSTLPTVTRTGYTLSGWYIAASGGTKISSSVSTSGSNFTSSSTTAMTQTSDHIIYAQWAANTYTITFNSNGGTGTMSSQTVRYGSTVTLIENTFTRSGYVFMGWATSSSGEVTYTDMQNITISGNLSLYAVWKEGNTSSVSAPVLKDGKYQIASAANLAWLAQQNETASLNGTYVQTAPIDLAGKLWTPIGNSTYPFKGTYDGQGFTISNLLINGNSDYQGLFGYCSSATIKNVRLSSGSISGRSYVGGIAGYAVNGSITSCVNFCDIVGGEGSLGGIVGYNSAKLDLCYNYGDIRGTGAVSGSYIGGIAGVNSSTITRCLVKAKIQGLNPLGGLVGSCSSGNISSCYFEGFLMTTGNSCGAFVGYKNGGTISECYAKATFTTNQTLSNYGMYLSSSATISNCVFEINGVKRYRGSDFSNWIYTTQNVPLPKEMAWLGVVGDSLTVSKLSSFGYASV